MNSGTSKRMRICVQKRVRGEREEWEHLQEEINTRQTKVLEDHIITHDLFNTNQRISITSQPDN